MLGGSLPVGSSFCGSAISVASHPPGRALVPANPPARDRKKHRPKAGPAFVWDFDAARVYRDCPIHWPNSTVFSAEHKISWGEIGEHPGRAAGATGTPRPVGDRVVPHPPHRS